MNEFVRSRIKARQWSLARQIRSTPLPFYTTQRQISPYLDAKLYPPQTCRPSKCDCGK